MEELIRAGLITLVGLYVLLKVAEILFNIPVPLV